MGSEGELRHGSRQGACSGAAIGGQLSSATVNVASRTVREELGRGVNWPTRGPLVLSVLPGLPVSDAGNTQMPVVQVPVLLLSRVREREPVADAEDRIRDRIKGPQKGVAAGG